MRFKVASRLFLLLIFTWCTAILGPEIQEHNNEWYITGGKCIYMKIPPPLCSELCFQFGFSWNSDLSIEKCNRWASNVITNPIASPSILNIQLPSLMIYVVKRTDALNGNPAHIKDQNFNNLLLFTFLWINHRAFRSESLHLHKCTADNILIKNV